MPAASIAGLAREMGEPRGRVVSAVRALASDGVVSAGPAEEVISRVHGITGQNKRAVLASFGYGILHRGTGYSFTYVCPASVLATYRTIFERSVRSVRISR